MRNFIKPTSTGLGPQSTADIIFKLPIPKLLYIMNYDV